MAARDAKLVEPAEAAEAPYQGRAGSTRVDAIHVPSDGGFLRQLAVHRAVNVGTDPHLRDAALTGALNRLEGVELAVPFVFHDPAARKLALVVPESLRHEELRERAKLLESLASEPGVPVPSYARDATTVVGAAQLAAYLSRAADAVARDATPGRELAAREQAISLHDASLVQRDSAITQRETELAQREHAVAQKESTLAQREQALVLREQRLRERAEDVTSREDEILARREEQENAAVALAAREEDLRVRLVELDQRGGSPSTAPAMIQPSPRAASVAPLAAASSFPPPPPRSSAGSIAAPRPLATPDVESVDAAEVEELDELEPLSTTANVPLERLSDPGDSVEELVDDDDVEEDVDADSLVEARDSRTQILDTNELEPAQDFAAPRTDTHAIPRAPAELADREMIARLGDGVELHVRQGDASPDDAAYDFLLQLALVESQPVVVLTLADREARVARRAGLDPRGASERRILEALRRRFEARAFFYDANGALVRDGIVAAPRELNAARVLDRVGRLRGENALESGDAIDRALAAPPPVFETHPFTSDGDDARLERPSAAARALAEIAEWSTPEKLDHALLTLSVPREIIDTSIQRVLERALEHGLALPAALATRAISAGLADDAAALVTRSIDRFTRTTSDADRGGLSAETVAEHWERLLAAAAEAEVAIDSDTHDLAWRAIRAVRGEETGSMPGGHVDAARLAQMSPPELVMLLGHPRHRRVAALALCDRGDPALADALCKAVRKMPRADVVRIVPRIVRLGDEAGDALVDGLSARKTFARQAFALALGQLKLRRAVVPLVHLLTAEQTDTWREIARVCGTFGNASFRTLAQKLHDPKASADRFELTLAHLAANGCAKQVEALESDPDPRVANMARRAKLLKDDARRQEETVSGKRLSDGGDPILAFSRRFLEELEGRAPETDLAAVPGEET